MANVANAGFYTSSALASIGAQPVYVDVDPSTQLMALDLLREALASQRLDAVVVTHLYGRLHDMERLLAITEPAGVPVLEDCAQAHGAIRDGRRAGSFGRAATFSFYPTKNLGAMGDGGAVVTNFDDVATRLRPLRQYGWNVKYCNSVPFGRNSRLDELQAAVLRAKLPFLDDWNDRRRAIARRYSAEIRHPHIATPGIPEDQSYVAHLYVLRCEDRNDLRKHLADGGIATDIHFPTPDHLQPAAEAWPPHQVLVTETLVKNILSLPCFPELTDREIEAVINRVNAW